MESISRVEICIDIRLAIDGRSAEPKGGMGGFYHPFEIGKVLVTMESGRDILARTFLRSRSASVLNEDEHVHSTDLGTIGSNLSGPSSLTGLGQDIKPNTPDEKSLEVVGDRPDEAESARRIANDLPQEEMKVILTPDEFQSKNNGGWPSAELYPDSASRASEPGLPSAMEYPLVSSTIPALKDTETQGIILITRLLRPI